MTTLSASHSTRLQTLSICNWPSTGPSEDAICTRLLYRVGGLDSLPCGQFLAKWFVDWHHQHRLTNRFWSALGVDGLDSLSCGQSLAKWLVAWHRQQRLATRFGSATGVSQSYLPVLACSGRTTSRAFHLASLKPLEWLRGWGLIPASPRRTELATITSRRPYVAVNVRIRQPRHLIWLEATLAF